MHCSSFLHSTLSNASSAHSGTSSSLRSGSSTAAPLVHPLEFGGLANNQRTRGRRLRKRACKAGRAWWCAVQNPRVARGACPCIFFLLLTRAFQRTCAAYFLPSAAPRPAKKRGKPACRASVFIEGRWGGGRRAASQRRCLSPRRGTFAQPRRVLDKTGGIIYARGCG
jgi:hypothetical protein